MSTVELSGEDLMPIADLIVEMQEKGTFRSKAGFCLSEKMGMWLAGKGAEKALSRFLEDEYQVSTKIDTRAYDDVSADTGDIWRVKSDEGIWRKAEPVEVKKTADYANHVAITKSEMRLIDENEPIVYIRTSWNPDPDTSDLHGWLEGKVVQFEIVGWCKPDDLHLVEQGAKPWTKLEDNWCQPLDQMRTDWSTFVEQLSDGTASVDEGPTFTFTE